MPDNKARKYTLSELIEQYIRLHLSKYPSRLKDQTIHLNWWKQNYGNKALMEISPSLLAEAKEVLLNEITSRKKKRSNPTVNRYFSSLSKAFTLACQAWQLINEKGSYIYQETCAQVTHYRNKDAWRDFIPRLDWAGAARSRETIVDLSSHPNAGWLDHGFLSPTYHDALYGNLREFLGNLK